MTTIIPEMIYSRLMLSMIVTLVILIGCTRPPASSTSSTVVETPATSSTMPSYGGAFIPALDGQGPTDIWLGDYESRPNVLIVEKGTTVTWTNNDFWKPVTVVSDDGLFVGNVEPSGGTYTFLFEDAGNFGYSVDPYSGVWRGLLIVTG